MKSNLFSGHNKLLRAIPLVIIAVALVMTIFGAGMNLGIDFTGGSLFTYKVGEDFDVSVVESALATAGIKEAQIAKTGTSAEETQLEVRAKDLGSEAENMRAVFEDELKKTYPNLTYYTTDTVGAVAGRDLINNAVKACLIVFVCLLIYIAIRFDFTSGLAALLALAHDILIMCAFMTFARGAYQVNTSFIAALLTIIGGDAFFGCTSLASMTIPDSVTEIGANPFPRSRLQSITLSLDNPTFAVVDGALVRKADNTLLSYFCGRQDAAYTIPQGILAIGDNAFAYADSLQSITIPDSVTSIGHSAFLFCRGLTDVTIPDSVTSIGNSAFSDCSSLATVTLPASISEISDHLFFSCDVLSSVSIPDSVTRIGESAFASCNQLHTIDIPDSVTIIDHGAFRLSGITSVSIPNSVTTIGNGAFSYCDTLTLTVTPDSYAAEYAQANGISYTCVD